MARIGFVNGRGRGTPVVFISANPSGSLVVMGPQGYPLDDATLAAHVFDGVAYPALPNLIATGFDPPTPREEKTADVTQLNRFLRERLQPTLVVVNALQRGVCDRVTFSRHASVPADAKDGDVMYFEDGVVGSGEGFWGLVDGTWNKL